MPTPNDPVHVDPAHVDPAHVDPAHVDPASVVALRDPRALRAYAHPLRLRLVGLLRTEGPLTATRAAELLGESSGATSFHLRQLAKFGLVEEAGGGAGRSKPWRATAMYTSLPNVVSTPELAAASAVVRTAIADRYHELLVGWIARQHNETEAWQRAAAASDYLIYVTAAELEELGSQIDALLRPFADRLADPARRPADARRVTYLNVAMPAP